MQLGVIGLGLMVANLTRRLMRDGHEVVVFDVNADSVRQLESEGAVGAGSLEEFVARLDAPRTAWIRVPAGFVQETADRLAELLDVGGVIVDGGNSFYSYYRDDIDRWRALAPKGIHFVDVGTSGGVFGLERGFCLMIGGEDEVVERFSSRGEADFGDQLLSAMRNEFGCRVEKVAAGTR
jgi:6-phosphogluconate dehydrogenase